eukprot:6188538-Pleurochrysis_carterae.AAC.2
MARLEVFSSPPVAAEVCTAAGLAGPAGMYFELQVRRTASTRAHLRSRAHCYNHRKNYSSCAHLILELLPQDPIPYSASSEIEDQSYVLLDTCGDFNL